MIREITGATYVKFLRIHYATRFQITLQESGKHLGYFKDGELIGVGSMLETTNTIRIKAILVDQLHYGQGIGKEILDEMLNDYKDITSYVSSPAIGFFKKFGFTVESEKPNGIAFMRRPAVLSKPTLALDEETTSDLNKHVADLAKVMLLLDDEEIKAAKNYVISQIKRIR